MAVSLGLWRYGEGVASTIGLIGACLFGPGCLAALAATVQPNRLELNAAGFTLLRLGRAPMRVDWSDVTTFAVQPGCPGHGDHQPAAPPPITGCRRHVFGITAI